MTETWRGGAKVKNLHTHTYIRREAVLCDEIIDGFKVNRSVIERVTLY